jgi:hypothetical protein
MLALGARAATLLLDLSPLILAQWKHLVECGTDPRRLALDDHDGKIAALLLDEIGVQYHEIDANEHERIAEALTKMEAWVRKLKEQGGPFDGGKGGAADALPSEAQAAESASADAPPQSEKGSASTSSGQAGTFSPVLSPVEGPTAGEKEPDPSRPLDSARDRPPAPYSAGGASLDWTRL